MVKNLNVEVDNCDFSGEWPEWASKLMDECVELDKVESDPNISWLYKKYYKWVLFRKLTKDLHC